MAKSVVPAASDDYRSSWSQIQCASILIIFIASFLVPCQCAHCPPAGTNASCQTISCGNWCKGVCACNNECTRFKDCCYDFATTCGGNGNHTNHTHVGPKGGPEQFHLSVIPPLPGDGKTECGMMISFASSKNWTQSPQCGISTVSVDGPFGKTITGSTHTYTDGGWTGLLHRVLVPGLPRGKTFWYQCSGRKGVFEATTPPPVGALPVKVAMVADLGENCDTAGCGNPTISALGKAAAGKQFDMLLHAGAVIFCLLVSIACKKFRSAHYFVQCIFPLTAENVDCTIEMRTAALFLVVVVDIISRTSVTFQEPRQ
eukprot:m.355222 g.355222  ORF g.355222 m.355222 type:complete len:315 (-) comp20735_c0_seq3:131-1075(-)